MYTCIAVCARKCGWHGPDFQHMTKSYNGDSSKPMKHCRGSCATGLQRVMTSDAFKATCPYAATADYTPMRDAASGGRPMVIKQVIAYFNMNPEIAAAVFEA